MIKEFAVDPKALRTWAVLKYVSEKFGVEQGRFISRFPKRWPEMVEKNIEEKSWRRRQQFIARLNDLRKGRKGALLSCGRRYENQDQWKVNTCRSHSDRPYHGIFADEAWSELPCVVPLDDAEDHHFAACREMAVPRTAQALADAVAPLLAMSREVVFVDPYFDPRELRFRKPLEAFLRVIEASGRPIRRCEYHLKQKQHFKPDPAHVLQPFPVFERKCSEKLKPVVPRGVTLTLVRWVQIDVRGANPGEHLHPRYILTDIGGVRVDSGLDEGEGNETTDIGLLTEELWKKRRNDFLGDPPAFAPADVDANGHLLTVSVEGAGRP